MAERLARRVLLIGWDAADWKVIGPLMDAGKMPALERLVNEGVMGSLATLHPVLSPMLWTSIATGKRPHKHGILGFTEPTPDGAAVRPVSSLSRRAKAVWNILNQSAMRSIVVGWWPSHPAEPLDGVMVSNHYHRAVAAPDRPWPLPPGGIHPERLAPDLASLRVHPAELGAEEILPFVPRAAEVDQKRDPRLAMVARILAECTTVHAAATWLLEREPWDLLAVYYDAIDHFCHGFMRYHPPRQPWIPERDFELYQGVVEAAYRYHDLMLGNLLAMAGEDTTVVLVSDHGFHPDHLRPARIPHEPAGPAVEHREFGIMVLRGPGIRRDEYVHGATLLDVAPTVLTLLGLPVGADMDGRPLAEAFERPPATETIPSWEEVPGPDGRHPADQQLDPVAAREALNQLVALGYIEPLDPNRERAVAQSVRESRFNLARSQMDAGLHGEAAPLLEDLWREEPSAYRFGIQLATCYRALGRIGELRTLVEDMSARRQVDAQVARERLQALGEEVKRRRAARRAEREAAGPVAGSAQTESRPEQPDGQASEPERRKPLLSPEERMQVQRLRALASVSPHALDYLMGFVEAADGRPERALEHLARAEQAEPGRPGLHLQIGEAYLTLRRWAEAERAFSRASEIDPDSPQAHLGLCRSYLGLRRNRRAAEEGLRAVGLLYHFPLAHFCLGVALLRLRRLDRAVEALRVAVAQNPNFAQAHERLALIYERRLHDPEQAARHRGLARETGQRGAAALPASQQPAAASATPAPGGAAEPVVVAAAQAARPPAGAGEAPEGGDEGIITVVSGLPRSGTSMMMRMLAEGGIPVLSDGARQADADNPLGYFEDERARRLREDTSWLAAARGKVVKIVAQLLPHLPREHRYRVIFMERDLGEVLASQRAMLERRGRRGAAVSPAELRRAFEQQVGRIKAWLRAQPNIEALFVAHAGALADPVATAAAVNRFVGGGLDASAMAGAVESRLHRQRQAAAPETSPATPVVVAP